jgi:WD40 repeat protein
VLSGSGDGTVKLWDVATGRAIRTFSGYSYVVNSVIFSPDGTQILSSADDRTVKLWDAATGREIRTFSGYSYVVNTTGFSPDGTQVLFCFDDGTMRLCDTSTGKVIALFIGFIDGEWVVMSPEGYYNASPNGDQYLNVRIGENVYDIDQYRSTYHNPELVAQALSGN